MTGIELVGEVVGDDETGTAAVVELADPIDVGLSELGARNASAAITAATVASASAAAATEALPWRWRGETR
jgi:hypothetical protein